MENQAEGIAQRNMVERICTDKEYGFQKKGFLLWQMLNSFFENSRLSQPLPDLVWIAVKLVVFPHNL